MSKVFLEITLDIKTENRTKAVSIYTKYKEAFLSQVEGANSKDLLVRDEDIQVLHGFDSSFNASSYLTSELFQKDVVSKLSPLLESNPEIRVYVVA